MQIKMQIGVVLLSLFAATVVKADVPQPPVSYYGVLRDAYGFSYTDSAEIWLQRGTNEVVRYEITGMRAGGVNYQLDVLIDDGNGSRYVPQSMRTGEDMEIFVRYNGEMLSITPTNHLTVPDSGETIRLDLSSGTDSDGDGLSDEWEQMLIENSDGALLSLDDVNPDDDFDGDGASNVDEYRSGTFPFLAYDRLAIDELESTADGKMVFTFFAVNGFTYRVESVDDLKEGVWTDLDCAIVENGELAKRLIKGEDAFQNIYFLIVGDSKFVRLSVK